MVEDLITASMAAGVFSNLKGAGKPLTEEYTNPYLDETEQRLNKILQSNGFSPVWIVKENEIRCLIKQLRHRLKRDYISFLITRGSSTSYAIKHANTNFLENHNRRRVADSDWASAQTEADETIREVNKLIQDFNLIAPTLERQFMALSLERERRRAVEAVESGNDGESAQIFEEIRANKLKNTQTLNNNYRTEHKGILEKFITRIL